MEIRPEIRGPLSGARGGYGQVQNTPVKPQTLSSAMERIKHLNSRLAELSKNCHALASNIGGPIPAAVGQLVGGDIHKGSSIIGVMNDDVDHAHSLVDDIEGAINAMQRSLGV